MLHIKSDTTEHLCITMRTQLLVQCCITMQYQLWLLVIQNASHSRSQADDLSFKQSLRHVTPWTLVYTLLLVQLVGHTMTTSHDQTVASLGH